VPLCKTVILVLASSPPSLPIFLVIISLFIYIKYYCEPGMVVHTCNPITQEDETQEDLEFQASLNYVGRVCLKKEKNQNDNNKTLLQFLQKV
jgi:hypothetical protein